MCNKPARGLTLIELLIFIVIIGIAANAMLGVFSRLTQSSANLLPDKQAQAIASSMMNEILAQPFTFCDPDDPKANLATAPSVALCGGPTETPFMGPEPLEARNGGKPFDNVNDYNSASFISVASPNQPPATGVTGIAALSGYTYQVIVASTPLPNVTVTPNDALLVTVTVRGPNGTVARLQGVRVRYTPRT